MAFGVLMKGHMFLMQKTQGVIHARKVSRGTYAKRMMSGPLLRLI